MPETAVAAHEGGNEVVCRCPEDFLRRGVLGQLAADGEHRNFVAEHGGFVDVMRDEHDGLGKFTLQAQQLLLEFVAHHRIHCAERFVHEQDGRISSERPGNPDTLLLPT
ncbi:hypothetical protein PJL18_04303 [Paenarthrobacter nicotinovorans]|nr:hypothetical protein [Paenarthrobacter nicotinovorans]